MSDRANVLQKPADAAITRRELKHLAMDAEDVLLKAEAVFPFDFFPDSIHIDRLKVSITRRSFFWVEEVISINIEDILNVESDMGPFFGTIKLYSRFFDKKPLTISYLTRSDTFRIKYLLQGYIIARNQNIDCSTISTKELKQLLYRLGSVQP